MYFLIFFLGVHHDGANARRCSQSFKAYRVLNQDQITLILQHEDMIEQITFDRVALASRAPCVPPFPPDAATSNKVQFENLGEII